MSHSLAEHLTKLLQKHGAIDKARSPVFVYGFELFLSTMASVVSIIVISLLVKSFYTAVIFLMVFIGIRLFAGGYHAKTYIRCFILTNLVYLAVFIVAALIPGFLYKIIFLCLIIFSTVVILALAPIRHKNHPLSEATYKKNQKIAWVITILIDSVLFLLIFTGYVNFVLPVASVTLAAIAVMMIIPKLIGMSKTPSEN